eukprot:scaffold2986_cov249-Pinguiococcus_pyrenoidosus.AAC.1
MGAAVHDGLHIANLCATRRTCSASRVAPQEFTATRSSHPSCEATSGMLSGTALLLATLVPCGVVVASEDLIANESRNFSEASRAARQKAPAPTLKLLAGGQGTTATHAMFTIMCDAGLT